MIPLQFNRPLFVKRPFRSHGKFYKREEEFIWLTKNISESQVEQLYDAEFLIHSDELEKQNKGGDRLLELNAQQLRSLVEQMNNVVKKRTHSAEEFNRKKCKLSKLEDRQVAIIRRFLSLTPWIVEDFYEIMERLLKEPVKEEGTEPEGVET